MNVAARVDIRAEWTFDGHTEDVVLLSNDAVTPTATEDCALQQTSVITDSCVL